MKMRFCLFVLLLCLSSGCGNDSGSGPVCCGGPYSYRSPSSDELQLGQSILEQYNLQAQGQQPQAVADYRLQTITEFNTDDTWRQQIPSVCQQAGYDIAPYGGQGVSEIDYKILEECNGERLELRILMKDNRCICPYLFGLAKGTVSTPDIAVSSVCIQ